MGLMDMIERAINEHGSAAILRERILLIREQAQLTEAENVRLREENQCLQRRVLELEAQVNARRQQDEYVECRGALFKRKPTGGFHEAVYCPQCRLPMSSLQDVIPFRCGNCKVSMNFTGRELQAVLQELS